MAHWREHSPPTNMSWVQFPNQNHMWVEVVVGTLPCSKRFFSGYSGVSLSSETNISKFQFDLRMHGHLRTGSCELLGAHGF